MRLQLVLLICLCLAALSLAKKGRKGVKIGGLTLKGKGCERKFEFCKKMNGGQDWRLTCHAAFNACKEKGKKRKGKKHGGSSKKRLGPKHHFCRCFKKLFAFIKKRHSKTNSDGQKVTVHEKIFEIAKSASEDPKRGLPLINGRPNKRDGLKECLRNFYCHPGKHCGPKKGGKRHGKKSKRKNRGAGFMSGKSRKGKKMGRRPWEKKSPLYDCVDSAKKCKGEAGSRKKQLKACAKAFFKCVQDDCNKA